MSTNTQRATASSSASGAQYAAYDWHGEVTDDGSDDDSETVVGHDPSGNPVTQQKIESLAKGFLIHTSDKPLADPIALFEDIEDGNHSQEGMVLDLTDPEVYPPTASSLATPRKRMEKKAPAGEQWRVQEDTGHVCFGGIVTDRPKEKLLDQLPLFFDLVSVPIPDRTQDAIIDEVDTMKSVGTIHDTTIMKNVARWVFNPNEIGDWR